MIRGTKKKYIDVSRVIYNTVGIRPFTVTQLTELTGDGKQFVGMMLPLQNYKCVRCIGKEIIPIKGYEPRIVKVYRLTNEMARYFESEKDTI